MNGNEKALEERLYDLRQEHKHLTFLRVQAKESSAQNAYDRLLQKNEAVCEQIQKQLQQQYSNIAKFAMPRPPIGRNVWRAFLVGGMICVIGEIVILFLQNVYTMEFRNASALASGFVVVLTAILTGIGIYDEIGRFGGAGSMVPISGFSNSIVSAALEWKASGMIYGIGAKIFTIAGPVILYGTMASVFLGIIYYIVQ